ncbi:MAG TPA: hypothetical protein VHQ65_15400 [Thermoanaerobaculia bacterium]|nr:hypothetical protein [Thermoanaerobaculia bacterium]
MKRTVLSLSVLLVISMITGGVANAESVCKESRAFPELGQSEYFVAESPTTVKFSPDVYFESVTTKEGNQLIRYGRVVGGEIFFAEEGPIECGCTSGCSGDCSTTISGGSASCRGGCYESSGNGCVSCEFREIKPE